MNYKYDCIINTDFVIISIYCQNKRVFAHFLLLFALCILLSDCKNSCCALVIFII